MARKINKKCQHCAALSVAEAIALHGTEGDDCWNPDDIRNLGYNCHRRRNHYRHRETDNRNRRRMRKLAKQQDSLAERTSSPSWMLQGEEAEVTVPPPPLPLAAVLVLYRNRKDAPVHAVAAEIWKGDRKVGEMKPVHCMGMRGDQVTAYLQQILGTLRESYGISRFEDVVKEIPVQHCPIDGCPISGEC